MKEKNFKQLKEKIEKKIDGDSQQLLMNLLESKEQTLLLENGDPRAKSIAKRQLSRDKKALEGKISSSEVEDLCLAYERTQIVDDELEEYITKQITNLQTENNSFHQKLEQTKIKIYQKQLLTKKQKLEESIIRMKDEFKEKLGDDLELLSKVLLRIQTDIVQLGSDSRTEESFEDLMSTLKEKISEKEIEDICQKQKAITYLGEIIQQVNQIELENVKEMMEKAKQGKEIKLILTKEIEGTSSQLTEKIGETEKVMRTFIDPLESESANLVKKFIELNKKIIKNKEDKSAKDETKGLHKELEEKGILKRENIEKIIRYCERIVDLECQKEQLDKNEFQVKIEIPSYTTK